MALRVALLKRAGANSGNMLEFRRLAHASALPSPLFGSNGHPASSQPFVLPESDQGLDVNRQKDVGFGLPSFSFGGYMELMAVPKKKVSPHKRGIRNGPKALKPIPVIIRCKSCGKVKLPHFYCCSGDRGNTGERSDSSNS